LAITRETVLRVARLARLELGSDEIERLQEDLGKILGYVGELAELPMDGVPETAHVAAERAPFRPDAPASSLDTETALGEAPRSREGCFAVPGFVDE
jgi:aspartyl-tRNA(Asn)/glutamyl-tRNA(Gln) amidotransferase subunit C